MKKIYEWFVYSSANPEKIALTVKGAAVLLVPAIIFSLQVKGIVVTEAQVGDWFNQIVLVTQEVLVVFGALMSLVGLVRKLAITIRTAITGA